MSDRFEYYFYRFMGAAWIFMGGYCVGASLYDETIMAVIVGFLILSAVPEPKKP